jgi:hypothetical protein
LYWLLAFLHRKIGKPPADASSARARTGVRDGRDGPERRQGQDPDAHLPPLLEAVGSKIGRSPSLPDVQVARVEHAAPDADPAARLPPLRSRVEAATGDADDLSEVQVAILADAARRTGADVTYFEARRIKRLFERYRELAVAYWDAVEPIPHGVLNGPGAPTFKDTDASLPLRRELVLLEPEVIHSARLIGAETRGQSLPPPAWGGVVMPFDFLSQVLSLWVGYKYIAPQDVLDAIDKCIGAAGFVERRILARVVRPWCWLVDVPALFVGWPFAILRRAGVPEKWVEGTGAQVVKAILTGLLWIAGLAWTIHRFGFAPGIQKALDKAFG